MPLATRSRLGPYEVISLLGAGAMGEVYLAKDTRLNRNVAIKIIDLRHSQVDEGTQRFEQEARAISALNHPNVVTIHDVGRDENVAYIVTELVEGESLGEYLQSKAPLQLREVLDIGIQIAEGLAAAHDEGLVHRDLKPDNIMLTPSGLAKILDFGLAKAVAESASDEATLHPTDTVPGVLLGTVAYMSPEQAKGERVSFYADQFALGLILYEMVSGTHPLKRETALGTLSAILTEDPPPLSRGSAPFQWLVRRCLHREPDHRYASTHDLTRELKNIREHLTEGSSSQLPAVELPEPQVARPPLPRKSSHWVRPSFYFLVVLLAGVAGYLISSLLDSRSPTSWQNSRFVPFATSSGMELFPAWSPNSRSVAYSAEIDGTFQILVRSTGASTPSQLTRLQQDCFFPFWSPDGIRVYFIAGRGLWSVGATGGTPENVFDNVGQAALAKDGQTLAVLRSDGDTYRLWTGSLADRKLTPLEKEPLDKLRVLPWSYLRFSPDGKTLGASLSRIDGRSEFWAIPLPVGAPAPALKNLSPMPWAREFSWASGKEIIYAERAGRSLASHLWRADLAGNDIASVTNGTGSELSPSVSPSGYKVAFSAGQIDYDVIRISFGGKVEEQIVTAGFEASPTISADGRFAYVTDRSGQPEIWLKEPSGTWERPLVSGASFGDDPTISISDTVFSPDGRRIAYRRAGSRDESIWISTLTGDPPVRLAAEPGGVLQGGPTWSPDGNTIAYFSIRNGSYVLIQARVGGLNPPKVLAENTGTYPRWSPRGDWIANLGAKEGLVLVSSEGSRRKEVGSGSWVLHGWSADGLTLYGLRRSPERRLELVQVSVVDGTQVVLADMGRYPAGYSYGTAVGAPPLLGFTMAGDGRSFITSTIRPRSDVWLIDKRQ